MLERPLELEYFNPEASNWSNLWNWNTFNPKASNWSNF
jgi:hypothetical protein